MKKYIISINKDSFFKQMVDETFYITKSKDEAYIFESLKDAKLIAESICSTSKDLIKKELKVSIDFF